MHLRSNLNSIDWTQIQLVVDSFQKKIYYYSRRNDIIKVRSFQKVLFQSRRARLLSIYKVIVQNKYVKFSGIDSFKKLQLSHYCELGLTMPNRFHFNPLRSIYFFKVSYFENPLFFISSFADRAKQELFKIIMMPEWEARFEFSSFGLVSGRSCYDALLIITKLIGKVYMSKISLNVFKCLKSLNYFILFSKLNLVGFCKSQLQIWLNLFVSKTFCLSSINAYFNNPSPIFILIINVIFYGIGHRLIMNLEKFLLPLTKFHFINYFNHLFIVYDSSRVIFLCQNIVLKFFHRVGAFCLDISTSNDDLIRSSFLGFVIDQFMLLRGFKFNNFRIISNYNMFLYPSFENIIKHQCRLHDVILVQGKKFGQKILIRKLNLIIKSWVQYFGNFNSNLTGHIVKQDFLLYLKLKRWVKRQKGSVKKGIFYWQGFGSKNWIFMTKDRKSVLNYHLHYI